MLRRLASPSMKLTRRECDRKSSVGRTIGQANCAGVHTVDEDVVAGGALLVVIPGGRDGGTGVAVVQHQDCNVAGSILSRLGFSRERCSEADEYCGRHREDY